MAQYDRQFIDDLRRRVDIVQVIERFVPLRKQGSHWLGICPFHDDRKPSMKVNPSMGIYKCFACGAGGDVFRFIMEREQVDFPEAIAIVAEVAGIPLPQTQDISPEENARRQLQKRILELHLWATEFFCGQLRQENEPQEYLKNRKLTGQTAKDFSIGWAPDSWDSLTTHLKNRGASDTELVLSGLASERTKGAGCYDRFRRRVIFPIHSITGQVVGFGGRTLSPDDPAKYLNSPETAIYHKSEVLFGFAMAKEQIRRSGSVLVVEGYMDVFQLWQSGIRNAVSVSGTALTAQHAELLKRYTQQSYLLFDGDNAGRKAARRSLPLLLAQGIEVRILLLPEGEDPDSLVRDHGPELFMEKLERDAVDFIDFLALQEGLSPQSSPEQIAQIAEQINELIKLIPNPVVSDGYRRKASERLRIDRKHIAQSARPSRARRQNQNTFIPAPESESLLAVTLLNSPTLRAIAGQTLEVSLLTDERLQEIVDLLLLLQQQQPEIDLQQLRMQLTPSARDLLERLFFQQNSSPDHLSEETAELIYLQTTLRLERQAIQQQLKKLRRSDTLESLHLWQEGNKLLRTIDELHAKSALPDSDNANLLEQYLGELLPLLREFLS